MRISARNANLRAILADDNEIRKSVTEMVMAMEAIEDEDIRGFRKAKQLDPTLLDPAQDSIPSHANQITLESSQLQLIKAHLTQIYPGRNFRLGSDALSLKEVSKDGVCYGICESSTHRNSAIIFVSESATRSSSPNNNLDYEGVVQKPGIIEKIIHYSTLDGLVPIDGIYLYIQELMPINIASNPPQLDPYRKYGFAAGYLCDSNERITRVIGLSQVVSHFALTTFEGINRYENFIHVLPLDRVCASNHQVIEVKVSDNLVNSLCSNLTVGVTLAPRIWILMMERQFSRHVQHRQIA